MTPAMTIEKFSRVPDSMLKEVSQGKPPADQPAATTHTGQSVAAPHLKSVVSEAEASKGADHTKISTIVGMDGNGAPAGAPGIAPAGAAAPVGSLIDAKLAVELWDAIIPGLAVILLHKLNLRLRKSELQLTEKEKGSIVPLMQKCLDSVSMNFTSPWAALGVTMMVIYGSKIGEKGFTAWMDAKAEKEAKEAARAASEEEDRKAGKTPENALKRATEEAAAQFTEEEILAVQKAKSYGRDRAIQFLIKKTSKKT